MEKENRNLKVLVVILCVLVLGLGGYLFYDKVLSDKTSNNNINNNEIENDMVINCDNIAGVYESPSAYYLILWNDGKYMYTNDEHKEETMGNYTIKEDRIILNYIYVIDRGENKTSSIDDTVSLIAELQTKELKINSLSELVDERDNVILVRANQSTNAGGNDFYTWVDAFSKNS